MSKQMEKPFEFIKKKDGSGFTSETYKNWYKARAYVLDKLKDKVFVPDSNESLHVVVTDVDNEVTRPLMLSIVRQVALSAHFINYKEESNKNRTVITIISHDVDIIKEELEKEEYLFYLPVYGKGFFKDSDNNPVMGRPKVEVDIEVCFSEVLPEGDIIKMTKDEAESFCNSKLEDEIFSIDTRKAVYASRMYDIGADINNLPYDDIHSTERYSVALDVFQFVKLEDGLKPLIKNEWADSKNQVKVLEALSNIFCSDCFESRAKAVKLYSEQRQISELEAWKELNHSLSKSEHARWVVEKLIMGYRPMSKDQRLEYEKQFGKKREQYAKGLKRPVDRKDLSHLDLCSFVNLRRIDPDNMKYDSFLVLCIPEILKRINDESK